jgi:hypothetical protein
LTEGERKGGGGVDSEREAPAEYLDLHPDLNGQTAPEQHFVPRCAPRRAAAEGPPPRLRSAAPAAPATPAGAATASVLVAGILWLMLGLVSDGMNKMKSHIYSVLCCDLCLMMLVEYQFFCAHETSSYLFLV